MPVFVDKMKAQFGRMKMSHCIATTDAELHAMMEKIGVARRWCQYEGTYRVHYDICLAKRALAVQAGAIEISNRELGAMLMHRRVVGRLCPPYDAVAWARERMKAVEAARKGVSA